MKRNQLTRGQMRRVMYIENKDGLLDGASAHIGWVEFSKSGRSVYYRGRTLHASKQAIAGNFVDAESTVGWAEERRPTCNLKWNKNEDRQFVSPASPYFSGCLRKFQGVTR